jgi:hypothetical protein
MILNPADLLGEATQLACMMVDQIEYIDLFDPVLSRKMNEPAGYAGRFCRQMSGHLASHSQRDQLKRIIGKLAARYAQSKLAMKLLSPEEVETAAGLVSSAIKGLIVAQDPCNTWIKGRRLLIKFTSIGVPWVDDPKPGLFVN